MDAAKCYVYLSDVSTRTRDSNNQNDQTWERCFCLSRWFTQCWTLRDLLASKSFEFFSREGHLLGDKQTLEWQIYETTTFPTSALRGMPLSHFSVDERMDWAARRHAKRPEDKAYCLMGISRVFMPPIYGGGKKNAFIRLKIQVAKEREEAEDEKEEINDDTAEIASAYWLDSLSSTITSSSTTLVDEALAAANEFVSVLPEDQALAPLFSMAFDRIKADRLQRNIKRLLQLYASNLQQEAKDNIEKETVNLVQLRARYIAYCIHQHYDKSALLKIDEFERLNDTASGRRALLESYLGSKMTQNPYGEHDDDKNRSNLDTLSEERAISPN